MTPLQVSDLKACLAKMRERRYEDLTVIRDRSLLTLGFFGAFRRGELAVLNVEDVTFTRQGLQVEIRKSKTDPHAVGERIGITVQGDPLICPVRLLSEWLEKSETRTGPIFRRIDKSGCVGNRPLTGQAVALIVKGIVERAGYDPEQYAGHSLRSGFATSAAARGTTLHNIMRHTRHKSERIAMGYIRPASVFVANATEGLGDLEEKKK
jgi:integrase